MDHLLTEPFDRIELINLERKGYAVFLDLNPIRLDNTYLNQENISEVMISTRNAQVHITRKDKNSKFESITTLLERKKLTESFDFVAVDGVQLDISKMSEYKFEEGSIKYFRQLTQKDYSGSDFDDLPQVKQSIGNGILIIITNISD